MIRLTSFATVYEAADVGLCFVAFSQIRHQIVWSYSWARTNPKIIGLTTLSGPRSRESNSIGSRNCGKPQNTRELSFPHDGAVVLTVLFPEAVFEVVKNLQLGSTPVSDGGNDRSPCRDRGANAEWKGKKTLWRTKKQNGKENRDGQVK